jgi:hypothetical protein
VVLLATFQTDLERHERPEPVTEVVPVKKETSISSENSPLLSPSTIQKMFLINSQKHLADDSASPFFPPMKGLKCVNELVDAQKIRADFQAKQPSSSFSLHLERFPSSATLTLRPGPNWASSNSSAIGLRYGS